MNSFEWDEIKNAKNIKKHSIDFVDAIIIFSDTDCIFFEVEKNNEIRTILIGNMNGVIITVIYTLRNNRYRIISARRSRKNEKKEYEDNKYE